MKCKECEDGNNLVEGHECFYCERKKPQEFEDFPIEMAVGVEDFGEEFGRRPKDQKEWEEFCKKVKKAVETQVDWSIVVSSARDNMELDKSEKSPDKIKYENL